MSKEQTNKTENKFILWVKKNGSKLLILFGAIFILLSLKTQTVLLTDETKTYTVELQYSVLGYCVSAIPMTKEAQPISADNIFFLGGMDQTVEKAAVWIDKTTDGKQVWIYASGYPKNNDKLIVHFCDMLKAKGISATKLEEK